MMLTGVNMHAVIVNDCGVGCEAETQRETTLTASLHCDQVRIREIQRVRTQTC